MVQGCLYDSCYHRWPRAFKPSSRMFITRVHERATAIENNSRSMVGFPPKAKRPGLLARFATCRRVCTPAGHFEIAGDIQISVRNNVIIIFELWSCVFISLGFWPVLNIKITEAAPHLQGAKAHTRQSIGLPIAPTALPGPGPG